VTAVLLVAETQDGAIAPLTYELMAAAQDLGQGGSVDVFAVGATDAAALGAAQCLHVLDASASPDQVLEALAALTAALQPDLILTAYSSSGLDLAGALSVKAERPLVAYCSAAEWSGDRLTVTSALYGGKLMAETEVAPPAILMTMPGAWKEEDGKAEGEPETRALPLPETAPRLTLIDRAEPDRSAVDITQAKALLCVGRAIGGEDGIAEARDVAELLGAEIAGSRPVIDAGWLPKAYQVGKSGMKVKPRLYLCLGVSGAPEHQEGMRDAELIVAVNKDPKAPIFDIAHYGTTCDLFDLLPALAESLNQRG